MLEDIAKFIPQSLRTVSGSVFYSGREAFQSTSSIYVLGLNPGGDPETRQNDTVDAHTKKVLEETPSNWSAYRDESWLGAPAGTYGMQPRVLHLFARLGMSPGRVPASNVIFARSRREATLRGEVSALADACWPVHQAAINQLNPKVILCFGSAAGSIVRRKLSALKKVGEFVETNNRRWRTCCFAAVSGPVVVVATHPSIADWTARDTDPSHLIIEALAL